MSTISPSFSPAYSPDYTAAPHAREACLNCDAPRMGEYCHGCGQHFLQGRLTIRGMVWEGVARKLSLEGGLLRTFADLSSRPGAMIRDYVRGRRQPYTHPVAYMLVSAMLSGLVLPLWSDAYLADLRADMGTGDTFSQAFIQAFTWLQVYPTASTLLLCCFFVPWLRLLFWSSVTTAESFVFALYVFGHVMLWDALLTPVAVMVSPDVSATLEEWSALLLIGITAFSAGGFFGVRLSTFLRVGGALVATFVSFFFVLLVVVLYWALILAAAAPASVPQ